MPFPNEETTPPVTNTKRVILKLPPLELENENEVLKGENPVAEFTKGSHLPQFLTRLEEPLRSQFEADYRARVLAAYPKEADGSTLFSFRRLFIVAQAKA